MKARLVKFVSLILGFVVTLETGGSFEITSSAVVVWVWLCLLGLGTKVFIQSFISPFMNVGPQTQVSYHKKSHINFPGTIALYLGIGLLFGEIIVDGNIGAISIVFLIYGVSYHIGMNHLNLKGWYFHQ
ncbi:MAG: hypothetical protein RIC35_20630 [Marinoscillum sp.]